MDQPFNGSAEMLVTMISHHSSVETEQVANLALLIHLTQFSFTVGVGMNVRIIGTASFMNQDL
jgi:hypothetical protein